MVVVTCLQVVRVQVGRMRWCGEECSCSDNMPGVVLGYRDRRRDLLAVMRNIMIYVFEGGMLVLTTDGCAIVSTSTS